MRDDLCTALIPFFLGGAVAFTIDAQFITASLCLLTVIGVGVGGIVSHVLELRRDKGAPR